MLHRLSSLPWGTAGTLRSQRQTQKPASWKPEGAGSGEVSNTADVLSTELPWRGHWV